MQLGERRSIPHSGDDDPVALDQLLPMNVRMLSPVPNALSRSQMISIPRTLAASHSA